MTPVPSPPDAALPTLERPLYLLTFFTAKDPAWTLSKLAKASGLPSASCLRAIRVLEKYQFLRRDHMEYRLGSQLVRLSANALASSPARRLALPYLEHLHRLTTRPVSWSVLEGPTAHTIEVVASPDHPAHQVQAGMQMNLTGGAPARVLLAFAPQELRRHVLEVHWAEYPHSRSSHEMLDGLARNTWLALEVHAQPSPTIEIAAPVFQGDGALIAALGLERPAGSSSSRAAIEQDLVLLNQTAQRISRELGYTREWRGDPAFFLQVIKSANVLTFTEDAAVGTDLINYPA